VVELKPGKLFQLKALALPLGRRSVFAALALAVMGMVPAAILAQTAGTAALHGTVTAVTPDGQVFTASGVQVRLVSPNGALPPLTEVSGEKGAFAFQNVPAGDYTLTASEQGFAGFSRKITLRPGDNLVEHIRLNLEEVHQQVEVREKAPPVSQANTTPPSKLSAPQLRTAPVAQQKVKQELPLMPGVIRALNGKTYIKGDPETQGMMEIDSAESVDPVTGSFMVDLPIDAIESLKVYRAPIESEFDGFSGGLTSIETKTPASRWTWGMENINPKLRAKQGHIVGIQQAEPRLHFSGPLVSKKLSFEEAFQYTMNKEDIRGLAWPHDESKIQGFNSFSEFQYLVSDRHLLTFNVDVFPRRQAFANLRALVPQPAASDLGQRGYSFDAADHYQFQSVGVLTTRFQYLKADTYAHGQGPLDMLVTPDGLAGNYFNSWKRFSHQEEAAADFTFPSHNWLGKHQTSAGGEVLRRAFDGSSVSRPVQLLRADGTVAEQIDFTGAGALAARDTQVAGFFQDHWIFNDHLALNLGVRYFGQSNGEKADFAPRAGIVYSPGSGAKTVFRAGWGVFHDRTPLLAGDFADNPLRTVSLFGPQGLLLAAPVAYRNVCAQTSPSGPRLLASCSDLGSTPYDETWRVGVERQLLRRVTLSLDYLSSRTRNEFVVNPTTPANGAALLMLLNNGRTNYRELEASVHIHPSARADITFAYLHSSARGDLNTLSQLSVPFEQPVIRPDAYANLPSDIPNRLTALGTFKLPWKITLVPAVDIHTGFPYSNVDVLQNYAGVPEGQRYPTYFSLNWSVFKEFPVPFHKGHMFRFGVYSLNTTNRKNPTDVYNSIASPLFGNFTGFDKRINGIIIGFAD
jgi:hypothetical protein